MVSEITGREMQIDLADLPLFMQSSARPVEAEFSCFLYICTFVKDTGSCESWLLW